MKLFQTPTSEKKKFWHILDEENDRFIRPLCNSGYYWFGGYHHDKPEMTKANVKRTDWVKGSALCKSCALQAYKQNLLKLTEADV